jgi:hypothetical protein
VQDRVIDRQVAEDAQRRDRKQLELDRGAMGEIAVRDHRPLGLAGRSRGMHDHRDVVGPDGGDRSGVGVIGDALRHGREFVMGRADPVGPVEQHDLPDGGYFSLESAENLAIVAVAQMREAEQQGWPAIPEHVPVLVELMHRIEADPDGAHAQRGEKHGEKLRRGVDSMATRSPRATPAATSPRA